MKRIIFLLIGVGVVYCKNTSLGLSSSSYQIEGGWNEDGRTPSVWDTFSHTPGKIKDGSTGDVAADSYHKWEEDIEWLEWLGAKVYRFSLSWTRILPSGRPDVVNPKGIEYYNNIINRLLLQNITPLVTIWHWDSPQSLHDEYGTWTNDKMIDDFVNYAGTCFSLFGDRVKNWITLNEPLTVTMLGYGNGQHAPGLQVGNPYEIAHRMLVAHANTYHLYKNNYYATQKGRVGIALNSDFVKPRDANNPDDRYAAERGILWRMGLFADPLFFGDYPKEIRDRCGGRLPYFDKSVSIQGTIDFFALNHYTTLEATSWYNQNYNYFTDPQTSETLVGHPSCAGWLNVYPDGLYGMIKWLENRYHLKERNLSLIITESGVATCPSDGVHDELRIEYLDGYIRKALQARDELDIDLETYCIWSLNSVFEWSAGFTEMYNLVEIDLTSNERKRTPKDSCFWLKEQTFFS